jgi:flagellar FliL protein
MAKKEDDAGRGKGDEGAGGAPAKAPMSTKLIVIIAVVVALLVGGGGAGAAFYFMGKKPDKAAEEAANEPPKPKKAFYHEFKPPFLANYQWSGRHHYVQMSIAVMARSESVIELVGEHQPLIRNNVGLLLSGQDFDSMRSPEGKEALRQLIVEDIQAVLKEADPDIEGIEQVYFINFVMQ